MARAKKPEMVNLPDDVARAARCGWRGALPGVVLVLLPLVPFLGPACLHSAFFAADVQEFFYPYHVASAAIIRSGILPLWNPYAFCGIPLLGDGQNALLYPPNWLFLILPGDVAFTYDVLLQFSLAGLGTYLFARGMGLWRAPAFVGAVAYMFCGFMTGRVVHLSIISGAALLPWVLLTVDRVLSDGGRRWFVAAAGVIMLQALCGHPQVPAYTGLAMGLYCFLRAIERWRESGKLRWFFLLPLRLAGIYALGLALAAVQLVPWAELISYSPRAADASYDFVTQNAMQGIEWCLFVFPYMAGSVRGGIYGTMPEKFHFIVWEHSGYAGILTMVLAVVALLDLPGSLLARRRASEGRDAGVAEALLPLPRHATGYPALFLAILLVGGALMAAGDATPFGWVIYSLPGVGKLRDVERAIVLMSFAMAGLSMIGLQRILEPRGAGGDLRPRSILVERLQLLTAAIVGLVPLLMLFVVWAHAVPVPQPLNSMICEHLSWRHINSQIPLGVGLASTGLLAWRAFCRPGRVTQIFVVALALFDMLAFAAGFNPTMDRAQFIKPPEVLAAFKDETEPFRKASYLTEHPPVPSAKEQLAFSWGFPYGIEDVEGFNSLQPRRYIDYLYSPQMNDVSYGFLVDPDLIFWRAPILDSLNVKYLLLPHNQAAKSALPAEWFNRFRPVYSNDSVDVFRNTGVFPRAFFVNSVAGISDAAVVLAAVEPLAPTAENARRMRFDGRRFALIISDHPPRLAEATDSSWAQVAIAHATPNQIDLSTQSDMERLLVLSEMYFPGWHATVDGKETEIFRTNYLFRGVVVPAGKHAVTFAYRPGSVKIGAGISAFAAVICLLLLWVPRRGMRHETS